MKRITGPKLWRIGGPKLRRIGGPKSAGDPGEGKRDPRVKSVDVLSPGKGLKVARQNFLCKQEPVEVAVY